MLDIKKINKSIYKAGYYTIMHDGIEHAGYLAFLGLLSLFPFLVFFVAFAGLLGDLDAGKEFVALVINNLPEDFIAALKPRIIEIVSGPPQGIFTLAILATIWTASSAVEGLRTILNRAYRVETPPAYIWRRLMSIAQFLVITAAIFVGMFFLVLAPAIWHHIELMFGLEGLLTSSWTYIRYGLSMFIMGLAVAVSYYVLPNIKQKMLYVLPGTFMVLILWVLVAVGLSIYIKNFQQVNLVYGSLEGIIIALLFFYIVGVVYIFGAEFNYQIEKQLGHKLVQKEKVPKRKRRPSAKKPKKN